MLAAHIYHIYSVYIQYCCGNKLFMQRKFKNDICGRQAYLLVLQVAALTWNHYDVQDTVYCSREQ